MRAPHRRARRASCAGCCARRARTRPRAQEARAQARLLAPRRSRSSTASSATAAPQDPARRGGGRRVPVDELRRTYRAHQRGRAQGRAGQDRARRGEPAPRGLHRQEVHEPRPAVPRPDPGGEHRPHEGGGQVRVQARLQVLDLRHLVDPAGDHPRHRRPGAHHPHPGAHDRDHQQAHPDQPLPRAGARARADPGGDRREDGAAARQGPQGPQDRQGAHLPRDPHRRGGGQPPRRLHRGQAHRLARPTRSST